MDELTLLYTHNLRGNIELLPRLHTFIRRLRGDNPRKTPLIDLGDSCAPGVWHCNATGGRSMLVALDGMGYTALHAGTTSPENRDKLRDHLMSTLIDDESVYFEGDLLFALHPTEGDGHLCVVMTAGSATLQFGSFESPGRALYLAGLRTGQVGVVQLEVAEGQTPMLRAFVVRDVPADTPPDPTIAGVVDFVLDEARYYQRRGNSGTNEDETP